VQCSDLAPQIVAQQPHQIVDLVERPLPILRGKPEQRQVGNPQLARRLDGAAGRFGATAMPGDAR